MSKINKRKGLTLIEMLVALTIFVIISITLGGVVIQMTVLQERIMIRNQQISELRFVLDYISNSVANAQNPPTAGCITLANTNFEIFVDIAERRRGIRFINRINEINRCQEIFLYPYPLDAVRFGRIQTRISSDITTDGFTGQPIIDLTSNIITRFNFNLIGNLIALYDFSQPRITVSITSNIKGLDFPITVQRSISKNRLDN